MSSATEHQTSGCVIIANGDPPGRETARRHADEADLLLAADGGARHALALGLIGQVGDTVSLIPLGGEAHGVTTRGLAYPLANGTPPFGPALGVSNEMTAPQARIQVRDSLLLCVPPPRI